MKVLSTAGGIAALDVDGSNTAANASTLSALGANDAELRRVATMYQAGQTLWRYRLSHFTPNDANWPYPNSPDDMVPKQQAPRTDDGDTDGSGASGGAGGAGGGGGGGDQQPAKRPDDQCKQTGSIIGCERRTLGETIGVAGTPVTLAYTSERSAGYRVDYAFDVALSDGVPDSILALMSKILLRVSVAGRTTIDSFPVQRGLHSKVSWDGRDAYGRLMQGQSRMLIQVAYVYATSPYGAPVPGASTFGQASGTSLPPRTRAPDVLWQTLLDRPIGSWSNSAAGLGGWSINAHHSYDPTAGTLYLGTGEKRSAGNLNPTVVGTGNSTWNPAGIVANPDGSMLVVDDGSAHPPHRARRIADCRRRQWHDDQQRRWRTRYGVRD